MSVVQLIVLFGLVSVTFAASIPLRIGPPDCDPNTGIGCLPTPNDCPEGCICNRTDVIKDDTTEILRRPSEKTEFVFKRTVTKYGSAGLSDENDLGVEDGIATKLHEKVQQVFRGILVSAVLFIVCACICVASVCVYCGHIRQTDRKLKQDVDALAKKLRVDVGQKAGPSGRPPRDPRGESCNVVVQDANVMCV